ncbi:MAG: inositol monophosphatase family protein [Holosporales bacterium]
MLNTRVKLSTPLINVMAQAASKAARNLVRDFGEIENLQVSRKGPGNFVTSADLRAEKILREELSKARPEYGFLMEESGATGNQDGDYRWIVDPLDGTSNFMHGLPHFAISIAVECRGEIISGLVYDPIKDEMFCAEKGAGAYVNERRIRVSARSKIPDALLGLSLAPGSEDVLAMAKLRQLTAHVGAHRRMGSAALDLCYTAAGRYDAFYGRNLGYWDCAAGMLIVREAGGYVSELGVHNDGSQEVRDILASNDPMHPQILKILKAKD